MAQLQNISPSTYISDSLALLMGNFFALLGHSSGSAFPSENLRESMFFFHTGEKRLYLLLSITPTPKWNEILDLNVLLGSTGNRPAYLQEMTLALSGKQPTIEGAVTTVLTSNLPSTKVLISNADGKVTASSLASTKLDHLSDVTSAIQAQLNGKQSKAIISAAPPGATDGANGDIWLVIE